MKPLSKQDVDFFYNIASLLDVNSIHIKARIKNMIVKGHVDDIELKRLIDDISFASMYQDSLEISTKLSSFKKQKKL